MKKIVSLHAERTRRAMLALFLGCAACSGSDPDAVGSRSDRETAGPPVPPDALPSSGGGGSGGSSGAPSSSAPAVPATPAANELALTASGLRPLEGGFTYEGWAIIDGAPVSTGKFDITDDGAVAALSGATSPGVFTVGPSLVRATHIAITIEPAGDADPGPSKTSILAGPVAGGSAMLTTADAKALGADLTKASGSFLLATPTDGKMTNERSGVWFLQMGASGPAPALVIPALPLGWVYEGWAVIDGTPVSTGRFTQASGADRAAPFSGDAPAPPFPGEDFLRNAPGDLCFPLDLRGSEIVITIEPSPDDSSKPFGALRPLASPVPGSAMEGVSIALANVASSAPKGSAKLQ